MHPVFALAPRYHVFANAVTPAIVVTAAVAVYVCVWAWGQSPHRRMIVFRNFVLCASGGIGCAIGIELDDLKEVLLNAHAVAYLLQVCLVVCPLAALLSWIRNCRRAPG
ncbi:MAG TPA: hypothetical protein VHB77_02970 [Planctomycetaceae bacterium]|nr:hypothetical protein [Planctomycetaceae bacterium]